MDHYHHYHHQCNSSAVEKSLERTENEDESRLSEVCAITQSYAANGDHTASHHKTQSAAEELWLLLASDCSFTLVPA